MSNVAEYAVQQLRQYATENSTIVRSTLDLSPLEEWLLAQMYKLHEAHPVSIQFPQTKGQLKTYAQKVWKVAVSETVSVANNINNVTPRLSEDLEVPFKFVRFDFI